MDARDVAAALERTAILLELKGENTYRVSAYRKAAQSLVHGTANLADLAEKNQLDRIPGVGRSLSKQVAELVRTGRSAQLEQLEASFPQDLFELFRVPGLGPKKIKILFDQLGIDSLARLEYACRENRLVPLKGFGAKTQANVLEGIAFLKKFNQQRLWAEIEPIALDLIETLKRCPEVRQVQAAGSFRRFKELVKDLDLVLETGHPRRVAEYLESLDMVDGLPQSGPTKTVVRLKNGLGVDLRMVDAESFPFALHHFTGSKNHNTQMRRRAKDMGLKLNEYGLFDPEGRSRKALNEPQVFALLDLPYIPPELREGLGEIEAAEQGRLPDLIRETDIKGLFHVHSAFSDGRQSIAEIVERCRALGFEYVGLADHSRSAAYAGGLTIRDLDRQAEEVARVRVQFPDVGLFWGIESDIRADGNLDYPDEILARFDFVIASVHSHFKMSEKEMTGRLIKAVNNPFTFILGHPSGRLLLGREPYRVDLDAVLEAAAKSGTVVEINANPQRLDLDWRHMRRARELGLKMVISPDAHDRQGLDNVRYGVFTARKGWLTAGDVINGLGRSDIQRLLATRKKDEPCITAAGASNC